MKPSVFFGRLIGHAIMLIPAALVAAVILWIVWLSAGVLIRALGVIAAIAAMGLVWGKVRGR